MKHIPVRMCTACRTMHPQNELIRIVRDNSDGKIKIDKDKKLFGRGMYICKNSDCVKLARKKRAVERALKAKSVESVYESAELIAVATVETD